MLPLNSLLTLAYIDDGARPHLAIALRAGLVRLSHRRGTLLYNGRTSEDNFLSRFPFKGGVVLEADWSGRVLWELRHPDHHHVGILLRNGNVLLKLSGHGSRRNGSASQRGDGRP